MLCCFCNRVKGIVSCSLCKRVYCTKECAVLDTRNHSSTCEVDEDLYRTQQFERMFDSKHICEFKECRSTAKLKACSNCKMAYYCSRPCQVSDWARHKIECSNLAVNKNKQVAKETKAFFQSKPSAWALGVLYGSRDLSKHFPVGFLKLHANRSKWEWTLVPEDVVYSQFSERLRNLVNERIAQGVKTLVIQAENGHVYNLLLEN